MVNDKFVPTSNENAMLICDILKCELIGLSRIDNKQIMMIEKDNLTLFNIYRKYLDIQLITTMEDHGYSYNVRPINPNINKITFKIENHDPKIFNLREEKLKRILK